METSTIDRLKILKCLALAMRAAIVPEYAITGLGNHNNIEVSSIDGFQPIHTKSGEGKNW